MGWWWSVIQVDYQEFFLLFALKLFTRAKQPTRFCRCKYFLLLQFYWWTDVSVTSPVTHHRLVKRVDSYRSFSSHIIKCNSSLIYDLIGILLSFQFIKTKYMIWVNVNLACIYKYHMLQVNVIAAQYWEDHKIVWHHKTLTVVRSCNKRENKKLIYGKCMLISINYVNKIVIVIWTHSYIWLRDKNIIESWWVGWKIAVIIVNSWTLCGVEDWYKITQPISLS